MKHFLVMFFTMLLTLSIRAEYNTEIQLQPVLKTDTTSMGQKIKYPEFKHDEVTILKVIIPPGKETGWHKHSFPVFACVLQGTLAVEMENKGNRSFPEGSSFAEVINTFHNGKNNSAGDVILIAFYMGEKDKPLSIRKNSR